MESAQKKLRLLDVYDSWDDMPPEIKDMILRNTDALTIMRLARDDPQSTSTALATRLDNDDNVWKSFVGKDFPFEYARPELHLWAHNVAAVVQGYLDSNPQANAAKQKLYPKRPHKQLYIILRTWYGTALQTLRTLQVADQYRGTLVETVLERIYSTLEPDLVSGRYANNASNRRGLQSFMSVTSPRWNLSPVGGNELFFNHTMPLIPFATILDFTSFITMLEGLDSEPIGAMVRFFQTLKSDEVALQLNAVRFTVEQYHKIGFKLGTVNVTNDLKGVIHYVLRSLAVAQDALFDTLVAQLLPAEYQDLWPENPDGVYLDELMQDVFFALMFSLPVRDEETDALRYIVEPIGRKAHRRGRPKHKKWHSKYKGKSYWHGDSRYKIAPGTKRGDSYCARSWGIIKKHGKTPKNMLSRKKWKCRGKKSIKGELPAFADLSQCAHCGAEDPQVKCGECHSVAYCNQSCADAHADVHLEY